MSYTSDMTDCGVFCSWCFRLWRVLRLTFPLYVVVNDWYVFQLTPLTCVFCNRRQSCRLHIWCFWLWCVSEPAFLDREDIHQAGMLPLHPQHARPYEVTHARTHTRTARSGFTWLWSDGPTDSSYFCYLPFCTDRVLIFALWCSVKMQCFEDITNKSWCSVISETTVFGPNRSCLVQFSMEFFFFLCKSSRGNNSRCWKIIGSVAGNFF